MDCEPLIAAAGVAPNVTFLEGTPVHVAKGVLVDDTMQTSVPGIYATGDMAEAPNLFSGHHLVTIWLLRSSPMPPTRCALRRSTWPAERATARRA
ncbi:MAG: FAD-dependent oxidoreductase [Candidatus Dechloromonas phosphoritropha]